MIFESLLYLITTIINKYLLIYNMLYSMTYKN